MGLGSRRSWPAEARLPYETEVRRGITLDVPLDAQSLVGDAVSLPTDRVWVGGFGILALPELEIWRRLFAGESLVAPCRLLIAKEWKATDCELIALSVPPSQHGEVFLVADRAGRWGSCLPTDRIFAHHSASELLMLGPPTEDAWEEMSALVRG